MNSLEVIYTKGTDEVEGYGFKEFAENVLKNKFTGKIFIVDIELGKRIFIKNESDEEFTIRYFIESQNEKRWTASYVVYKFISNGDGTSYGEPLYNGVAKAKYLFR